MFYFRLGLSILLGGLLLLMVTVNLQAVEPTKVIVTPTPAPKEVVVIPRNYVNCFSVGAGWYKGVWYPEHRVCQYDLTNVGNNPNVKIQGEAWVAGHWACTKYIFIERSKAQCTNWDWNPGRWIANFNVY